MLENKCTQFCILPTNKGAKQADTSNMSLIYFPHRLARLLEKLNFQRQQAIFKGINISSNWTMGHGSQP